MTLLPERALPPEVAERMGPFYVYALVDPRDDAVFYVGKGTGQRLLSHGREALLRADSGPRSDKVARIREIRCSGHEPRIDIVRHGIEEAEAFLIEAALIDCLDDLSNAVAGHDTDQGRSQLAELAARYGAQPVDPGAPPVVLIRLGTWRDEVIEIEPGVVRIGNGYKEGITPDELADATRAWWRISPSRIRREGIRHAVAVHEGVTRGVVAIGDWIQREDGRRAFAATPLTEGTIFEEWVGTLGRRVEFSSGSQNPISYWSPE
ncbi:MAG: hypothetical protein HOE14_08670 [Gemmatimonadales bacterium]|nr:hypothetical protein [Gemmatimonadales bacterium]MBT7693701.1 hypothetical protein [Gemmatimonadales bacterium]